MIKGSTESEVGSRQKNLKFSYLLTVTLVMTNPMMIEASVIDLAPTSDMEKNQTVTQVATLHCNLPWSILDFNDFEVYWTKIEGTHTSPLTVGNKTFDPNYVPTLDRDTQNVSLVILNPQLLEKDEEDEIETEFLCEVNRNWFKVFNVTIFFKFLPLINFQQIEMPKNPAPEDVELMAGYRDRKFSSMGVTSLRKTRLDVEQNVGEFTGDLRFEIGPVHGECLSEQKISVHVLILMEKNEWWQYQLQRAKTSGIFHYFIESPSLGCLIQEVRIGLCVDVLNENNAGIFCGNYMTVWRMETVDLYDEVLEIVPTVFIPTDDHTANRNNSSCIKFSWIFAINMQ